MSVENPSRANAALWAFTAVRDALADLIKQGNFHAEAAHHHLMQIGSPEIFEAMKNTAGVALADTAGIPSAPKVTTTVELTYCSDPDNTEQVIAFIGEHNIPECKTCGGNGEYETDNGPVGCPLCNSRLIPFIDANGVEQHLDWGETVQNVNGKLYKQGAKDA